MECKQQNRPYCITFCGVNGVGKSTNLAKVRKYKNNFGWEDIVIDCYRSKNKLGKINDNQLINFKHKKKNCILCIHNKVLYTVSLNTKDVHVYKTFSNLFFLHMSIIT